MKIEVYKIDRDVPIPEPVVRGVGVVPIDKMEVGESILFPAEQRSAVQSKASQLKKRKGKEFTVRLADDENCRIWRVS